MAYRVTAQPNGLFAVFSTVVDDFVGYDYTEHEVVEFFCSAAFRKALKESADVIDRAKASPERFDQLLKIVAEVHGSKAAKKHRSEMSKPIKP